MELNPLETCDKFALKEFIWADRYRSDADERLIENIVSAKIPSDI